MYTDTQAGAHSWRARLEGLPILAYGVAAPRGRKVLALSKSDRGFGGKSLGKGGRSKGGKGGKGGRPRLAHGIRGITNEALHAAMQRAGVLTADDRVYEDGRAALRSYMARVLRGAVLRSEHGHSHGVVTSAHITHELMKGDACGLYGFGHPRVPPTMFCAGVHKVLKHDRATAGASIDAVALAVVNDFCADVLSRLVAASAALQDGGPEIDDYEHFGDGASDFERARNCSLAHAPVACSADGAGAPRVRAPLVVRRDARSH